MLKAQFQFLIVGIIALLGGTTTQVAADLIIDEFDEITTGDWPLFTFLEFVKTTDSGLASVLGGRRTAWTNISPEPVTPGVDWIRANVDTDRGLLEYAHSSGAPGILRVGYHMPASFDLGDFAGLRVDFANVVLPYNRRLGVGIDLVFSHNWDEIYQTISTNGPQSVFFPFDDFVIVELASLDLADVMDISLFRRVIWGIYRGRANRGLYTGTRIDLSSRTRLRRHDCRRSDLGSLTKLRLGIETHGNLRAG